MLHSVQVPPESLNRQIFLPRLAAQFGRHALQGKWIWPKSANCNIQVVTTFFCHFVCFNALSRDVIVELVLHGIANVLHWANLPEDTGGPNLPLQISHWHAK